MSYALRCRAARTCSRRALETTISRIRAATNSDLRFYTTPPATIALETHVRSSSQRQHASSATELQLLGRNRKRFNIDNIRRYASQAEESSSTGEDNPGLQEAVSLLKLILPVTTHEHDDHDQKDVEPLALLVHPQQPLSYLERLIQAEVPPIKGEHDQLRPPTVSFLAMEVQDDALKPKSASRHEKHHAGDGDEEKPPEDESASDLRGGPGEGGVEMYRNLEKSEPEAVNQGRFVRWSSSTEIGDFIRDAARAREFLVAIEGSPLGNIPVGVPSFNDRTYYLRMRLRKISQKLKDLAVVKHECDMLAHRGAQRMALGGLGVLVVWWYVVYRLTFQTSLGWDTMEPVTYLVSLSALMCGYAWFLYHNREISYRSALDFTINRRQQRLYKMKVFDLQAWESLVDEANELRREIKTVAAEYDVDWDETADEHDVQVTEELKKERHHRNGHHSERKSKDIHDEAEWRVN
ncbi:hypothetical protein T310_7177 [Rasamsonia emersonii CBS 393.64]|uniref:Calcium uniporter protein n=1 Tax=Rasamsonia emersonii (strain ATCC 16479 / CBS 393.64 / IMI 116815) TaxID=1408163 RepID=A0A0F4YKV9_RASE3|nr:hypothetical protein T310_7177 [Rasamsonia emersonii CBS 393.64]KKA18864.1 hypothetical protein T310_7177 [Rasamsonia emersonii CBS 393.64]